MIILNEISESLLKGDSNNVFLLTESAVKKGISAKEILDSGLISGMKKVGDLFRTHKIYLPEVLLAAKAMYSGLDILKPILIKDGVPSRGKIVIGTIYGDLHDIGKNLVGIMLKGAGFDVIDLGKNVSPENFVDTAVRENAAIIGMSALLTTTMQKMRNVVEILEQRNLRSSIKTIIGGAPVTEEFMKEIGADSYGFDAGKAVDNVSEMLVRLGRI